MSLEQGRGGTMRWFWMKPSRNDIQNSNDELRRISNYWFIPTVYQANPYPEIYWWVVFLQKFLRWSTG